jgi:hypothetical protein
MSKDAAIVIYQPDNDSDDDRGHPCINPNCERRTISAGVCFGCANSKYDPEEDGIDVFDSVLWL